MRGEIIVHDETHVSVGKVHWTGSNVTSAVNGWVNYHCVCTDCSVAREYVRWLRDRHDLSTGPFKNPGPAEPSAARFDPDKAIMHSDRVATVRVNGELLRFDYDQLEECVKASSLCCASRGVRFPHGAFSCDCLMCKVAQAYLPRRPDDVVIPEVLTSPIRIGVRVHMISEGLARVEPGGGKVEVWGVSQLQAAEKASRECCQARQVYFPAGGQNCPCLACEVTKVVIAYRPHAVPATTLPAPPESEPEHPFDALLREVAKPCPKCGVAEMYHGYGLAGGGMGPYSVCMSEHCDYFDKQQEPIEEDDE